MPESLPPPNPAEVQMASPDTATASKLGQLMLDKPLILLAHEPEDLHRDPQAIRYHEKYRQTAFYAEPNGDTTIHVSRPDAREAAPSTFGPGFSQEESKSFFRRSTSSRIENEVNAATFQNRSSTGGANRSIGIRFDEENKTVTYPSDEHLRQNLAELKAKTGHAPLVKTLQKGTLTSLDTMGTLADEGALALAGTPEMRIHDLLLHLPFWAALPKETFEAVRHNAQELMAAYRSADESTRPAALKAINDYNLSLEYVTETLFATDNNAERYQALATILFTEVDSDEMYRSSKSLDALSPEKHQEIERHSALLLDRTLQIRSLYPATDVPHAA